ncbi:hypothetical protein [Calidithermus timidus]|jgi:hypothetical protein|uniref:hypothetical protein n=1 Tax=Calidithermus timidus TaxID=307124 RepID=UPI00037D5F8A|nr:hypothetical protein [Calidithermus timidus]
MKKLAFAGIAALIVLAGCAGGIGGAGEISGKVSRSGGSSAGALVVACLVADDCATYGQATAAGDGSYKITGLGDGKEYYVLGFLDVNGDGNADYVGWYENVNADPTVVKPPKGGVNFTLVAVTGAAKIGMVSNFFR